MAHTLFDKGVSSIPADRQKHGLILDYSVAYNLVLQNHDLPFSKRGILKKDAIYKHAAELTDKFDIRGAEDGVKEVGKLSGGNQQKVIIARKLPTTRICLLPLIPPVVWM